MAYTTIIVLSLYENVFLSCLDAKDSPASTLLHDVEYGTRFEIVNFEQTGEHVRFVLNTQAARCFRRSAQEYTRASGIDAAFETNMAQNLLEDLKRLFILRDGDFKILWHDAYHSPPNSLEKMNEDKIAFESLRLRANFVFRTLIPRAKIEVYQDWLRYQRAQELSALTWRELMIMRIEVGFKVGLTLNEIKYKMPKYIYGYDVNYVHWRGTMAWYNMSSTWASVYGTTWASVYGGPIDIDGIGDVPGPGDPNVTNLTRSEIARYSRSGPFNAPEKWQKREECLLHYDTLFSQLQRMYEMLE